MKKQTLFSILFAVAFLPAMAEETNLVDFAGFLQRETQKILPTTSLMVQDADVAGVGEFINQPSTNTPTARILVHDYWAGDPGTNVLQVSLVGSDYLTDWVFPTNVPVVFFAMKKSSYFDYTHGWTDITNLAEIYTNEAELAVLSFPGGDRAWFRTTRDNGLLYTFATNLWDCLRANTNFPNYYKVLREAEKVPFVTSSRLNYEAFSCLDAIFRTASDSFLLEKYEDPLLSSSGKNIIFNRLAWRGWTYTNDVWIPPQQ